MTMSRKRKTALAALAALALIAVTVVAATGLRPHMAVTEQTSGRVGACADCAEATCSAEACASVVADRCIGCARCVAVAPEAFRMNAQTGEGEITPGAPARAIARGAQACPVGAIVQ